MRIMPYIVMPTCKLEDCAHCSAQYKTPACNPLVVHSCFAYRLIHVLIQNILDLFNQICLGLREEPLGRSLFERVTLTGDNIFQGKLDILSCLNLKHGLGKIINSNPEVQGKVLIYRTPYLLF